jgi:hypothetical protein
MTIHESWTDRLSDYLDDELPDDERAEVTAHLAECAECARTLEELKAVVATAAALPPAMPARDLWAGVSERIEVPRAGATAFGMRRFSFTLPELAAASLLLAALSGGAVALVMNGRIENGRTDLELSQTEPEATAIDDPDLPGLTADTNLGVDVLPAVSYADAQFEAAVTDLERTLQNGRGRLDAETVAVVQENLSIIDRAMAEARAALEADPANGYLSRHLMEARRRKLNLLRRATALTEAN